MGTSYIPGPDLSGISDIGEAIAALIDPNRGRREAIENMLLANPDIGQGLAAAQREAQREFESRVQDPAIAADVDVEIPTPNVLERFGFKPEQTEELLGAFPENEAERLGIEQKNLNIARLQAESQRQELLASMATNKYTERVASSLNEQGIPELSALSQAVELTLGIKLNQTQKTYLGRWIQHLEGLKETNPFEYRRALAAMNSEAFLTDLQRREQFDIAREGLAIERARLSLQEMIAGLESATDSTDQQLKIFDLTLEAEKNLDTQLDRMSAAIDEGSEEEKRIGIIRANEAAALVRALSPGAAGIAVDVGKKGFISGKIKGIRLTRLAPGSLAMPLAIRYEQLLSVFEGADPTTTSFESLQESLLNSVEGREFLSALTPNERSKFLVDAQARHGAIQLSEEAEVELPTAELSPEETTERIAELELILREGVEGGHSIRERIDARKELARLKTQAAPLKRFPGGVGG